MILSIGRKVQSTWNDKIRGYIIGYGSLQWPTSDATGGDEASQPVYIVELETRCMISDIDTDAQKGYIGCIVLHANRVKEI